MNDTINTNNNPTQMMTATTTIVPFENDSTTRAIAITTDETKNISSVLDSLPYIDNNDQLNNNNNNTNISDHYEQYALSLIENELRQQQQQQLRPQSIERPINFRTDFMKNSYQTIATNYNSENNNNDTTTNKVTRGGNENVTTPDLYSSSFEEWELAVQKQRIIYEKERLRFIQLQLDTELVSTNYKVYHDSLLQPILESLQTNLQQQISVVEEINYQRQSVQQQTYKKQLDTLSNQYTTLLYQHFQIQNAIQQLEEESDK